MNNDIEKIFVTKFVVKNYQERILFELNSVKKRERALSRFAHDAKTFLQLQKIVVQSSQLSFEDIKKYIPQALSGKEYCYIIGGDNYDKKIDIFNNVFGKAMEYPMSLIIMCGTNIAIVKEELDTGCPIKYLLYCE